jgi:hypothetical protein
LPTISASGCSSSRGACSSDHATLLKCDPARGRFVVWNLCTGPKHCVLDGISGTSLPVCDRSEASLGGPCAKGDENARSCSADFRDVLLCKSGTYKRDTTCPPSKRCFNAGHGDLDAMCTHGIP